MTILKKGGLNKIVLLVAVVIILLLFIILFLALREESPPTNPDIEYTDADIETTALQIKDFMLSDSNMDLAGELISCTAYLKNNVEMCEGVLHEDGRQYCVDRVTTFKNAKALMTHDCDALEINDAPFDVMASCNGAKAGDCSSLSGDVKLACEQILWDDYDKCSNSVNEKIECRGKIIIWDYVMGNDALCEKIPTFIEKRTCYAISSGNCDYLSTGLYHDLAIIQLKKFDDLDDSFCDKIYEKELIQYCKDDSLEYSDIIMMLKELTYEFI